MHLQRYIIIHNYAHASKEVWLLPTVTTFPKFQTEKHNQNGLTRRLYFLKIWAVLEKLRCPLAVAVLMYMYFITKARQNGPDLQRKKVRRRSWLGDLKAIWLYIFSSWEEWGGLIAEALGKKENNKVSVWYGGGGEIETSILKGRQYPGRILS